MFWGEGILVMVARDGNTLATPLAWARKRGHEAIAEKLTAARAL